MLVFSSTTSSYRKWKPSDELASLYRAPHCQVSTSPKLTLSHHQFQGISKIAISKIQLNSTPIRSQLSLQWGAECTLTSFEDVLVWQGSVVPALFSYKIGILFCFCLLGDDSFLLEMGQVLQGFSLDNLFQVFFHSNKMSSPTVVFLATRVQIPVAPLSKVQGKEQSPQHGQQIVIRRRPSTLVALTSKGKISCPGCKGCMLQKTPLSTS